MVVVNVGIHQSKCYDRCAKATQSASLQDEIVLSVLLDATFTGSERTSLEGRSAVVTRRA